MIILAIGAHADDIELGCGGSLLKWAREGHTIHQFVVTNSEFRTIDGQVIRSSSSAQEEAQKAASTLGATIHFGQLDNFQLEYNDELNSTIRSKIEEISPDIVLAHYTGDAHRDHSAIGFSVLNSARHIQKLLFYQSNWYIGDTPFCPNIFIDISDHLEAKKDLLLLFESEFSRVGAKWIQFIESTSSTHGLQVNSTAAEGFMSPKFVI